MRGRNGFSAIRPCGDALEDEESKEMEEEEEVLTEGRIIKGQLKGGEAQ